MQECIRSKFNLLWLGCGILSFGQRSDTTTIDVAWLQFSSDAQVILVLLSFLFSPNGSYLSNSSLWPKLGCRLLSSDTTLFFPHSVTWNQTCVQLLDTKEPNRSMILLGCSNCGSISSRYYHHTLGLKFSSQVQAESATMDLYRSNTLPPLSLDALFSATTYSWPSTHTIHLDRSRLCGLLFGSI